MEMTEIDVADFHITTATTTTGTSKKRTSSNNYRELWLSLSGKIS